MDSPVTPGLRKPSCSVSTVVSQKMTAVSSSVLVSSLSHAVLPVASRVVGLASKALAVHRAEAPVGAASSANSPSGEIPTLAGKPTESLVAKQELDRQVHELQARMDKLNPDLAFVLDQDSGRTLLQLTDKATKEVILQYPTQATLQIAKALDQFQKGQLLSKQA